MSEEIAARLTAERERIGYSKADFARKIGISRESLRLWELGQGVPSTDALLAARQFGVDICYVLTGVCIQAPPPPNFGNIRQSGISGVGINAGNVNINNTLKNVIKAEYKPGREHITEAQAAKLKEMVAEVVKLEQTVSKKPRTYQAVWSALNSHCQASSYLMIRGEDYEKARTYLSKWIGRLNRLPDAASADNHKWRKSKYAYININTKDEITAKALSYYLKSNNLPSSLSELSDSELSAAYDFVAGRRKR